jgi:hypothetical protein
MQSKHQPAVTHMGSTAQATSPPLTTSQANYNIADSDPTTIAQCTGTNSKQVLDTK